MPDELDDILRRLKRLEDNTVRYRQGVVTDAASMSVALGGSDVPYVGVRALGSASVADDDVVGALTFGNDMLVLGPLGAGGAHAATISGSQALPTELSAGAISKIALNTVVVDTDGWWDTSSKRFIPQVAGRWLITARFHGTAVGTAGGFADLVIALNGGGLVISRVPSSTAFGPELVVATQLVLNGTTDYVELWGGAFTASISGNELLDFAYLGPS